MVSAEEDLWDACSEGHHARVEELLASPTIDVNWADGEDRTPFFIACQEGHLAVVELLLKDTRIDPNKADLFKETPFNAACREGHLPVVTLLLKDTRVDPCKADVFGHTPFYAACREGHLAVVELLLKDTRIDPCKADNAGCTPLSAACSSPKEDAARIVELLLHDPRVGVNSFDKDNCSPLWFACREGNLEIVQMILASRGSVDTTRRSAEGEKYWNSCTAAEIAREKQRLLEKAGEYRHPWREIVYLVGQYERDPTRIRQQLCKELGWITPSGKVFALVIFLCDGLLQLDRNQEETAEASKAKRFLQIATQLHLDLQMLLINRSQRLAVNLIPSQDRELGFRELAKLITEGRFK